MDGSVAGSDATFSDDVTGCCPRMAKRDRRLAAAPESTPAMARPMARGGTAAALGLLLPPPLDDTGLLVLAEKQNKNINRLNFKDL